MITFMTRTLPILQCIPTMCVSMCGKRSINLQEITHVKLFPHQKLNCTSIKHFVYTIFTIGFLCVSFLLIDNCTTSAIIPVFLNQFTQWKGSEATEQNKNLFYWLQHMKAKHSQLQALEKSPSSIYWRPTYHWWWPQKNLEKFNMHDISVNNDCKHIPKLTAVLSLYIKFMPQQLSSFNSVHAHHLKFNKPMVTA